MELHDLIKRAKKGDEHAFYELLQTHKQQLYRIAYSYLKSEADAIEAIQETTYRAFRSIRKLKKPDYFSTWLIRILINYCNDELKKRSRLVFSDQFVEIAGSRQDQHSIEMEEAVDQLEEHLRQVITLKYFHDLKIKEIAQIMNLPEGTIKTWLAKGLKILKQNLSEEGGAPGA
ncbi:sigma-70 family RNA polymerase sigma factor [Falsibacillus pallidus]|uniref:RNA polymerase sigma (SigV) subunit n=1 Tax=Falsibacillus pallidus TaxID=493781 RepID=A0A370GP93_9BACI|nr:sigma-70 family RNA polymerase sigma factor [Falsibacillus pallidus]RDI45548.1 RNA polymerase sigma (SigV) subunit [Falsibacillus pallidus]